MSTPFNFKCPRCGGSDLEEITLNATIAHHGLIIYEEWSAPDYPERPEIEDGDFDRYQCYKCGYVIQGGNGPIENYEDLVEWLKENVKQ